MTDSSAVPGAPVGTKSNQEAAQAVGRGPKTEKDPRPAEGPSEESVVLRCSSEGPELTSLQALLNACPDCVKILDRQGRILFFNQAGLRSLELNDCEALLNASWIALWPDNQQLAAEAAISAAGSGEVGRFQGYLPTFEGTPKWWDVLVSPIECASGPPERFLAVCRDITGLRATEERTRLALEAARAGTIDWWIDSEKHHWDARTYEIFGISPGETITLASVKALIHPDDISTLRDLFLGLIPVNGQAQFLSDLRIMRPGGLLRHLELRGQVYYANRHGQTWPVRMIGTVLDVTETRSAEEALRRSEAHFRSLAEAIPGFLFISESDGTNTYINRRSEEYTGLPAEDLRGAGWRNAIHPADRESTIAQWARSIQEQRPYEVEYRFRRHDGVYRWFLTRAVPVQHESGGDVRWLGVGVDIDAQKRAESALAESELRFRTMAEAVPSLLFVNLPGGSREYTGPRWLAFTGTTAEECSGKGWRHAIHPDDLPRVDEVWAATLYDPRPLDLSYRVRRQDGNWRWVISRAIPFDDPQSQTSRWFGTATDVHDLRQAEQDLAMLNQALENKVREFETLLQVTPIGIGIAEDPECRVIRWNPAMAKMFGVEIAVNSFRTPEWDRLSFHAFQNGRELKPEELPMHLALSGKPVRGFEVDVLHADGAMHNLFGYADPLRDAQGAITGCVGVYVDVTELTRMRAALERSNEELQRFAYVASHDLQSPLRTVRTFAQMLERRLQGQLDGQASELLSHILEGADRMMHLVRDLLAFAQAGNDQKSPLAVNSSAILHEATESLRLAIQESGAVIRGDELPSVVAHPAHLLQLFQNLLSNAIKYRQPEVPPSLFISAEKQGRYCLFRVRDNGEGFDPEQSQLIFEPFKRLHGKEISGTGIGLATCHRIVQRYQGQIWAHSKGPGFGATFCFTLPASDESSTSSDPVLPEGKGTSAELGEDRGSVVPRSSLEDGHEKPATSSD